VSDVTNFHFLEGDLRRDEGVVLRVYDDATGQPIIPGSHVFGHPTIGIGRALDVNGITEDEATDLLWADMAAYAEELIKLPWFETLDQTRRRAIMNMRHQLGLAGLLAFQRMIAALEVQNYTLAAAEGMDSQWARVQSPQRALRVMALLEHGDPDAAGVV
jgi:lysozyme